MHWLWIHLGLSNGNSAWYLFPSGWGGILLVSGSILAVPYTTWKRHNCHVARCPRIGRFPVDGTTWTVCRHHHPDDAPTAETITDKHRRRARDVIQLPARCRRTTVSSRETATR